QCAEVLLQVGAECLRRGRLAAPETGGQLELLARDLQLHVDRAPPRVDENARPADVVRGHPAACQERRGERQQYPAPRAWPPHSAAAESSCLSRKMVWKWVFPCTTTPAWHATSIQARGPSMRR